MRAKKAALPSSSSKPVQQPLSRQIGTAFRRERVAQRLTQSDVAELVGIVPDVYGRIERGEISPSLPTFRQLCVTLKVSADSVLSSSAPREEHDAGRPPETATSAVRRLHRRAKALTPSKLAILCRIADALKSS